MLYAFNYSTGVLELKPEIVKKSESAKILLSSSDPVRNVLSLSMGKTFTLMMTLIAI